MKKVLFSMLTVVNLGFGVFSCSSTAQDSMQMESAPATVAADLNDTTAPQMTMAVRLEEQTFYYDVVNDFNQPMEKRDTAYSFLMPVYYFTKALPFWLGTDTTFNGDTANAVMRYKYHGLIEPADSLIDTNER